MSWDGERQKDYIQVDERIQKFYAKFPDGRLQSELMHFEVTGRGEITARSGKQDVLVGYVMMKGYAYRTPDDPLPGTGFSTMLMPGGTPYTRNSEIENAETSAWGRAIAALGIEVRKGIATADEIRNKEHDGTGYEVRITPSSAEQPEKGGHQKGVTRPQIEQIIELSKTLDYNPSEMSDIITGLANKPQQVLPDDLDGQKKAVKELMVSLTGDEAGHVIQTLLEATSAPPTEEDDDLPDVPKQPDPEDDEDALTLGYG